MTYTIAQPCVDVMDRSCVEECPVDCIYEGKRSLYITPTSVLIAAPASLPAPARPFSTKMTFPMSGLHTTTPTPPFSTTLAPQEEQPRSDRRTLTSR